MTSGEYLQSQVKGTRLALPEAMVVAAVAAVLVAFVNGFVGRLGERVADRVVEEMREALGRSRANADPEAAVEALRLLEPYLPGLASSTAAEMQEEVAWIRDELVLLGFSRDVADTTANDVLAALRDE